MRILYTCICIYWICIDIHMSTTYKHFMVNTKKLPYLLYMRKYAYNVMSPIVMGHHVVK